MKPNELEDANLKILSNSTCSECAYFRRSPHMVIAPIKSINADGVCENRKWKHQPIVLDSKKDTCELFKITQL
jgi:hypothetical protein